MKFGLTTVHSPVLCRISLCQLLLVFFCCSSPVLILAKVTLRRQHKRRSSFLQLDLVCLFVCPGHVLQQRWLFFDIWDFTAYWPSVKSCYEPTLRLPRSVLIPPFLSPNVFHASLFFLPFFHPFKTLFHLFSYTFLGSMSLLFLILFLMSKLNSNHTRINGPFPFLHNWMCLIIPSSTILPSFFFPLCFLLWFCSPHPHYQQHARNIHTARPGSSAMRTVMTQEKGTIKVLSPSGRLGLMPSVNSEQFIAHLHCQLSQKPQNFLADFLTVSTLRPTEPGYRICSS